MMTYSWELSSIIIGILVVVLSLHRWYSQRKYKLPSGPWGLPFIGYLPFLGKHPHETLKKLTERYGTIYSMNFGGSYTIVLNDFVSAKEAFNNPSILDRPPNLFDFHPGGMGFAGYNGEQWIEQRRHTMKTLKDAGMGKIPWESSVEAEIEDFIHFIEDHASEPLDLYEALGTSVSNNMVSIILGKRLLKGDARRNIVDDGVRAVIRTFNSLSIVAFFPKLMKLLARLGLIRKSDDFQKMLTFNKFIRSEVEYRKNVPANEQNEEIFIDRYLLEAQRNNDKQEKHFFNEKNLVGISQTLVIGGSDTSRTTLLWLFLAMATYPEVQKKVQEEIDIVLGKDGRLNWSQRSKLPYTYATTLEVQRWRTVALLGVLHRASEDTTVGDYDVPKGTNVIVNFHALHTDPKYWKDPDTFEPKRFLHEDGTLRMYGLDSYAPFSIGRRICPGQMIAVMEIFHYFTAIMQKFDICPLEDTPTILEGISGATFHPVRQKLRFIPRT